MKHILLFLFCASLSAGFAVSTAASQIIIRSGRGDTAGVQRFNRGDVMIFPEFGGLVTLHGHDLRVDHIQPPETRVAAYQGVDVREGDLLLLINGERVKTITALSKAYDSLAVGAPVKLGIQRDVQIFNVSFTKADLKDLPNIRIRRQVK